MNLWPDGTLAAWGTLAALGAFHGVNPGMGWLFAVALGMQENRAAAVWRALLPLGFGHACAVALAIAAGVLVDIIIPSRMMRWPIAALLVLLGIWMLVRPRHPRYGGMRIGMVGLTIWSFLVATAHGAGLMVMPVWLVMSADHAAHASHLQPAAGIASGLTATAVHGVSYLFVTAAVAWIVFTRIGVGLLKRTWINLDVIWASALILTGGLTVFVASP